MRRPSTFLVATFALAAGCRSPTDSAPERPPEAPSDFVLSWTVSHPHWGTEALILRQDGTLRLFLERPGAAAETREAALDGAAMASLERAIAATTVCAAPRSGREGRPNESRPTLSLRFATANCTTTQWFDDWRSAESLRPAAAIIADLRRRAAARRERP